MSKIMPATRFRLALGFFGSCLRGGAGCGLCQSDAQRAQELRKYLAPNDQADNSSTTRSASN